MKHQKKHPISIHNTTVNDLSNYLFLITNNFEIICVNEKKTKKILCLKAEY